MTSMPFDIDDFDIIAEESVIFQFPNGVEEKGRIFLTAPLFYEGDSKYPRCWYCLRGLTNLTEPFLVAGLSSYHALLLALCSAQIALQNFQAEGGKVLYSNGESEFYLPNKFKIEYIK